MNKMDKVMKYLSIFLIICSFNIFFGAFRTKDLHDFALAILALALGLLAYKNYK
ncbi:MAG: hypothetical protein ACM3X7_02975 [Solirubrobacterales bacterium]